MDYRNAFAISASGMTVEKLRLETIATNMANMHAVAGADGRLYRPLRVMTTEVQGGFHRQFNQGLEALQGTRAVVVESNAKPRAVYDPGHPAANPEGYVQYPGVNQVTEMVNMISALRAYEANVVAMNAAKSMAMKALEIGGNT